MVPPRLHQGADALLRQATRLWRGTRLSPQRIQARICIAGAVLLAVLWGAIAIDLHRGELAALEQGRKDSANLTIAFREHINRTLTALDQIMIAVAADLEQSPSGFDLPSWIDKSPFLTGMAVQIATIGPHGMMRSTNLDPHPAPVDLSDRAHFRAHLDPAAPQPFISQPVIGRVSKKWSIQISRRLEHPDGSFAGVLVVSLDPFYLSQFFDSVNLGALGMASLVGRDAIVRATSGAGAGEIGEDIGESALFARLGAGESLVARLPGPRDGVERIYSLERVPGFPLVVLVGLGVDDVTAGFHSDRRNTLIAGAAVSMLILLLLGQLIRALVGLHQSDEALRVANNDLEQRVAERTAELSQSLASLREAQAHALRAEKMASLGTLAGGIAHEINTPIQFIGDNLSFLHSSLAELAPAFAAGRQLAETGRVEAGTAVALAALDHDFLAAELPTALAEAQGGVARISEIVRAIGQFSHPGGAKKPEDAAGMVGTAVTVTRNSWRHAAELAVDIEPGVPPVPCHAAEIQQVLLALIVNATHAIEERGSALPGRIEVSVRRLGEALEFAVRDNGGGIQDEHRSRLWDLFFTTKPVGKGTGQGLAICHNIVSRHGGTIDFESEIGKGSRFFFRLPLADLREPAAG